MSGLPARTGWLWLKQGTGLFRKQPAGLTTLLFANILIFVGIGIVPFIGPFLAVVLIPSLSMAFMQGCLMIDRGQRVTPALLLTGLRKPGVIALCKVGLIYLVLSLVMEQLNHLTFDAALWKQVSGPIDPKNPPVVHMSDVLGVFMLWVFQISALMSLCFAAPLTYWQNMGPGKATFYSFFAVMRSAKVFLVLLVAWSAILLVVCTSIVMVLGNEDLGRVVLMWMMFLFMLLLQCAMYAGYRQIFGVPEEAPKVDLHA